MFGKKKKPEINDDEWGGFMVSKRVSNVGFYDLAGDKDTTIEEILHK